MQNALIAQESKKKNIKKYILISVIIVIIAIGFFLLKRLLPTTSPIVSINPSPSPVIKTALTAQEESQALAIAKRILNWTWYQKDERGVYTDLSICQLENNSLQCSPLSENNRVIVINLWARFKYYQKTGDEEELSRVKTDLAALKTMLDGPYVIQTNFYNCILATELYQAPEFNEEEKNTLARVCEESEYELSFSSDLTTVESGIEVNEKITAIAQNSSYDLTTDTDIATIQASFSTDDLNEVISILAPYFFFSADENALTNHDLQNTDLTITKEELLNHALTYYLYQQAHPTTSEEATINQCRLTVALATYPNQTPTVKLAINNLYQQYQNINLDDAQNTDEIIACAFAKYITNHDNDLVQRQLIALFYRQDNLINNNFQPVFFRNLHSANDEIEPGSSLNNQQVVVDLINNSLLAGLLSI